MRDALPTAQDIMDRTFFASQADCDKIFTNNPFDYVVIGSGICAWAFVERALGKDPSARILLLEQGGFFLPQHLQSLSLPYHNIGRQLENFPWVLSNKTQSAPFILGLRGMIPFFGGRSIAWSGWCPRPLRSEMNGWPERVIDAAFDYFVHAEELLKVIPANEIPCALQLNVSGEHRGIFSTLQHEITRLLQSNLSRVPALTRAFHAPIAMEPPHHKFSTPSLFLSAARCGPGKSRKLQIVANCSVRRVHQRGDRVTTLDTSRGIMNLGEAKLILAMGTISSAELILNSFPQIWRAGRRLTAHFISLVVARIRRSDFKFHRSLASLELGAVYIAGIDEATQGQYHIQLSAISDEDPFKNIESASRYMPDAVAAPTLEQLSGSAQHVVFVCAAIGEMDHLNKENWMRTDGNIEPPANTIIQLIANERDAMVWNVMDETTFSTLEDILSPGGASRVEYWHEQNNCWRAERPGVRQIRIPAAVHEASTLWIGGDDDAVVGLDYRLQSLDNIYVTGAGLWPRNGSWNPTLTTVALSQHLADKLTQV